jgi:class 3 adenylate cyclase
MQYLDAALDLFQQHGAKLYLDQVIAKKLELQGAPTDVTTSIEAVAVSVHAERPDLTSQVAPDGTVTIYFCDIVDSTPLNLRLGDEAWLEMLRSHNAVVEREVEAHGGAVVKSMGDGFMAIFPSARGAVRASIAIQREFASRNETAETPMRMRIGLHTGEPVRDADDFFGNDVNYAARVASAAAGDEILVSSLLHALVASSGEFALEARRPVALKGLEGEHVLHAVGWA